MAALCAYCILWDYYLDTYSRVGKYILSFNWKSFGYWYTWSFLFFLLVFTGSKLQPPVWWRINEDKLGTDLRLVTAFWQQQLKSLRINKSRGEPFLWNRVWYLSWFWAGWQYWKFSDWALKYATFEGKFFMFSWEKYIFLFLKNILASALKVA